MIAFYVDVDGNMNLNNKIMFMLIKIDEIDKNLKD